MEAFKLLNWNIGGAKVLELPSDPNKSKGSREHHKEKIDDALAKLIYQHDPDVITLQEYVEFEAGGKYDDRKRAVDRPRNYELIENILIDTRRHSHQGKWDKVRRLGGWNESAYFGQGNAFFVHERMRRFPIFSLPRTHISYNEWRSRGKEYSRQFEDNSFVEHVPLEAGLYFGDRDSEPRAASVIHLVYDRPFKDQGIAPQDVFVVNAHLTTLTMEREGVPSIDRAASDKRLGQLSTIFDDMISRYNRWAKENYPIRGKIPERPTTEMTDRHPPIWMVAGDFNFTPESEEYVYVKRRNFRDFIVDHGRGTKSAGFGKDPTLTVDYVFGGPLFAAIDPHEIQGSLHYNSVQVDNITRGVSDHYPISVSVPL
jgi:endonuclease/exonuclease/phosphatase family metal-dependent hydrolase